MVRWAAILTYSMRDLNGFALMFFQKVEQVPLKCGGAMRKHGRTDRLPAVQDPARNHDQQEQ
jgi:hypothetical protein